jgi:hypothetical protein
MGYWLEQRRLRLATISIFSATAAFFGLVGVAGARITQIDVTTNTPAFDDAPFGAGQYQMINGTVRARSILTTRSMR